MATASRRKPKPTTAVEPAPVMNIITALNNPDLFGRFFPGDTWSGWHTVLKAAFALPMDHAETAFFQSVAGNRLAPAEAVRELWLIAGRRAGKDSIASVVA